MYISIIQHHMINVRKYASTTPPNTQSERERERERGVHTRRTKLKIKSIKIKIATERVIHEVHNI